MKDIKLKPRGPGLSTMEMERINNDAKFRQCGKTRFQENYMNNLLKKYGRKSYVK